MDHFLLPESSPWLSFCAGGLSGGLVRRGRRGGELELMTAREEHQGALVEFSYTHPTTYVFAETMAVFNRAR
jgi:hypothetical protein